MPTFDFTFDPSATVVDTLTILLVLVIALVVLSCQLLFSHHPVIFGITTMLTVLSVLA